MPCRPLFPVFGDGRVDTTVRLWDVARQRRIGGPLIGHIGWAFDVEFAPDGRSLASVSLDGTIQQWSNYSFEEYRDQLCRMIDKQQAPQQWQQAQPDVGFPAICPG